MSDTSLAPDPAAPAGERFLSFQDLKAAHTRLQSNRQFRDPDGPSQPALLDAAEAFVRRAAATGQVLATDAEREAAQRLVTFWSNLLYRAGRDLAGEDALAEFDAGQAPDLSGIECPYAGLGEVPASEAWRFAGFRRSIQQCIALLRHNKLVAVTGARGSGRTSFVRAGLLPALGPAGLPTDAVWAVLGSQPLDDLTRPFLPAGQAQPDEWIRGQAGQFQRFSGQLTGLLGDPQAHPRVLVVDHFDRLFRYADPKTEVPAVARNLVQAARAGHRVVLIARSDSVTHASRLPEFRELFQAGQVPFTLSAGELRELIEEPARRVQLKLDAEVVDRLILDVQAEPAALTLLQFALLRLWDRRQGNRITAAVYDEVGGGRDAVGRVADEVLRALAADGRKAVARSVLLALIRPGVGQDYVAEEVEPASLDRLGHPRAEVEAVLSALEAGRLVRRVPGGAGRPERFAVILESLPYLSPQLKEWLDEDREAQRQRARLRAASEEWLAKGKARGALWAGLVLADARTYAPRGVAGPLEEEFLTASERAARIRWWVQWGAVVAVAAGVGVALYLRDRSLKELADARGKAADSAREAEAFAREAEAEAQRGRELERRNRMIDHGLGSWGAREFESLSRGTLWLAEAWNPSRAAPRPDGAAAGVPGADEVRVAAALRLHPPLTSLRFLEHNGRPVAFNTFSPGGRWLCTLTLPGDAAGAGEAYVWDARTGDRVALNGVHPGAMHAAFNAEEDLLATAHADGAVQVWRLVAPEGRPPVAVAWGAALVPGPNEQSKATCVAFGDRKGDWLAAGFGDGTARAWRNNGRWWPGYTRVTRTEPAGEVTAVALSPDGKRLGVIAGGRARLTFLDRPAPAADAVEDQRQAAPAASSGTVEADARGCLSVAFDPAGGDSLFVTTAAGQVWEWTPGPATPEPGRATGNSPLRLVGQHDDEATKVVFNPAGGRAQAQVLSVGRDGRARLFRRSAAGWVSDTPPLAHEGWVVDAAFSADGTRVVTGARDQTARVWDAATGRPLTPPLQHRGTVTTVAFRDDGRRVVAASGYNRKPDEFDLREWDTVNEQVRSRLLALPRPVTLTAMATGPGSNRLVTVAGGSTVQVWDLQTDRPVAEMTEPGEVTQVAVAPDGRRVAVAVGSEVRAWDLRAEKAGGPLVLAHGRPVRSSAFSPDGGRLFTACADGTLRVWDLATATAHALQQEGAEFAVWRPDGKALVTVSNDREAGRRRGDVRLWTLGTDGKWLGPRPLADAGGPSHAEAVLAAAFSPSGDRVATASEDDSAKAWDVAADPPRQIARFQHQADVNAVAFSPTDGRYVATGSTDRTAQVWDVDQGDAESVPFNHKAAVRGVTFSPDGRWLLTWSADSEARIWEARGKGGPMIPFVRHESATGLWMAFTPDGSAVAAADRVVPAGPGAGRPDPRAARSADGGAPMSADAVRVTTWHLGLAGHPPSDRDRLSREAEYLAAAAFDERANGFEPLNRGQLEERARVYAENRAGRAPAAADEWALARFREAKAANRPTAVVYWAGRLSADVAGRWQVLWDTARAHRALGQRADAARAYALARRAGPTGPEFWTDVARFDRWEMADAAARLRTMANTNLPGLPKPVLATLAAAIQAGCVADAGEAYALALREAADPGLVAEVAEFDLGRGEWRHAVDLADRLAGRTPPPADAWLRLARAFAAWPVQRPPAPQPTRAPLALLGGGLAAGATDGADAAALGAVAAAAGRAYEQVLEARPEVGLLVEAAGFQWRRGDWRAAERLFDRAREQHPTDPGFWRDLGRFYAAAAATPRDAALLAGPAADAVGRADRLRQADRAYSQSLSLVAKDADAARAGTYAERARLRLDGRDWAGAVADFTRAIDLGGSSRLRLERAAAYQGAKQFERALDDLTALVRLAPADPTYLSRRAEVAAAAGKWAEAAADLRAAAGPPGRNSWAHIDLVRLGLVKLTAGDRDGYRAVCDELVELARRYPDPAIAHSAARLLTLQPTPGGTAMLELARKAVARAGAPRSWRGTLGAAMCRDGQLDAAITELAEARRLEAEARETVWDDLFLAIADARAGRRDEAKRLLADAERSIRQLQDPGPFEAAPTVWQTLEWRVLVREATDLSQP
jgi:WD40 repeat protein/tetratricopeptide (TPR) repeat protein